MKLKSTLALLTCSVLSMNAHADTVLGLYLGVQGWQVDSKGSYQLLSSDAYQVDGDNTRSSFYAALEHPIPLLPNIKVRQNNLTADTELSATEVNFDHRDYSLYYEIFDNDIIAIDVGINGKTFDGRAVDIAGNQVSGFSETIPTAYLATRVGLPFTHWAVTGEAKALTIDDSSLTDVQAALEYRIIDNLAVDVSISAGYRSLRVDLDDVDGLFSDIDFNGPFLSVDVHF
ncbi:TIGR04219 family outer membrane beta-barrel protein [Idiomarina seosinensis]|uniref:TIGR04219 family outer membrane beta-barrel protein n=1 Tax=Idiomarina seosinensis TaxID=281739 RepID=UPI00384E70B8